MINMGKLASFARRSTPLWIVAIMLCWVAAAAAQPTGGLAAGVFEIDGNLVSEDASRFDWFTGTPGTNNGVIDPATCQGKVQLLPAFMDAAFYRDDHWAGNALDLTTFAGGGNKNNDCIAPSVAPWSLAPGSGPGKNDLTEAYSASYVDPATGDNWLMLAFATRSTNGSSEMDFEFNTEGLTVGATTLSGPGPDCGRTIGDFIVSINFEAGGSLPAPAIYTWDGTTYVPLDITPPPGGQPSFLVSVNTAPVSAPCGATTPDGTLSTEYITRQFAEIAINLTAAGVDLVDYCGKPQSTLGFKTRSSTGFTSSLKDVKLFPFHLVPSVESTITGTLGLCAGETTTLCGPDAAQSASPISYLWSTGETSQCITLSAAALGAGTHPVSLVVSNTFGCRDSNEVQVVVHPELQASVASASVCTGESATLTAVVGNATAPLAYAWSNGATSASIVVSEAGEYCVTVTDANGCEAHACGTLVVHAPVVAAVSDQAVCSGETGTMTATVTNGGTAPFTYSWSNGANTESIAVTAAGEYCVTVTDANGCTANACGTLVVRPALQVTVGDAAVCAGETATLLCSAANGTGPYTMVWSNGSTAESITVGESGEYCVTVTDANGCVGQACGTLTVRAPVEVDLGNIEICSGETATLRPGVTGAVAPMSCLWSTGATTATLAVSQSGEYSVTVTDANGCVGTAVATVIVHPAITAAVADITVCTGENGTLEAVVSTGDAPFTYEWNTGATGAKITVTTPGEYCVTVTDANGCVGQACGSLAVRPELQVTVDDAAVCAGETATLRCFTTNGTGPYTMVWSTGSTAPTITVGESGEYCVTVTDANGCVGQACGTLTVRAPVEVDLGNIEICSGETATLRPGVTGAVAPMQCVWNTGATTATLVVSQSGEYSVTVTDANGCTGWARATVTVHPAITAAVANIAVCAGENGTLEAVVSTGDAPFTYEWNTGDTGSKITATEAGEYCVTVTDANGCVGQACGTLAVRAALQVTMDDAAVCAGETATLRCSTVNGTGPYTMVWSNGSTAPTITVGESGEYCVTVTDANGCVGQACGTLTVRAPVDVDLGNIEMCSGETATLRPDVSGAVSPMRCVWSTGATTATLVVSESGEYSVTVTDANGCTGLARATVTVHPAITAAVANIAVCAGENGTLEAVVSTGDAPFNYEWNTGATGAKLTAAEAGEYCVTVTDANGCTGTACAVLTVYPEITAAVRDVEACDGEAGTLSVNATGGTAPFAYEWNTGETTRFITRNQAGEYCVTVTDANGCSVESCGQLLRAGTPVCEIQGPSFVCVGHTATFSVDPQTGAPAVATNKPLASRRQAPMVPDLVDATLAGAWLEEAPHAGPEPSVGPGKLFVDPTVTGMTIEWNVDSSEGCQVLGDLTHPSLDVRFTAMGRYVIGVDLSSSAGCGSECEIEVVVVDCNAIGCPRTVGFWEQQCEQAGNGSTKFDRDEVQMIVDCVDEKTLALNFGGGNEGFETFCEIIATDDMNQRHQAKRQYAGMLANVCTGYLGLVAANGDSIRLFEPQPIDFPPFQSQTIGALIDEMDEWLLELEHLDLEDAEVKSRYSEIIRVADSINNAKGIGATCFNFHPDGEIEESRPMTRLPMFKPSPNPFKGQMSILYTLTGAQAQNVEIVVYDIAGRRVRVLENGLRTPGNSVTVWDGRDDHGVQAARGVYYVRGRLGDQKFTSRVVLLRD